MVTQLNFVSTNAAYERRWQIEKGLTVASSGGLPTWFTKNADGLRYSVWLLKLI